MRRARRRTRKTRARRKTRRNARKAMLLPEDSWPVPVTLGAQSSAAAVASC